MIALICFVLAVLASPFKSKSRLEAENAVLRHQLIVLQRRVRGLFGGIGPAFGAIGVGNRTRGEGARQSRTNYAR